MIESVDLEKHLLAGILKHPEVWAEISAFVSTDDFSNHTHKTVFTVIKNTLNSREELDTTVVAQKVKDLNITFDNNINIFDYLEALKIRQVTEQAVIKTAAELKNVTVRRNFYNAGQQIQKEMLRASDKDLDQIIAIPNNIINKQANLYEIGNEPENLFEGIEDHIEELGNSPVEEVGLIPPYKNFRQMFGGFTPGDLYIFAAPKKEGKSTLLLDLMLKTCNICNENVKGLYLDTELETYRQRYRIVSSLSGVNEWYLKTGNWRKNPEMVKAIREKAFPILRKFDNSLDHIYVGGMDTDKVCSIIRRWHAKNINPDNGERAIVCYDYIKLTGEKVNESWKEYQVIGEKTDKLKQIATEIQAPLLAACQTNEEGRVAISARMAWFCSFLAYFKKKDLEEIMEYGIESGTHKMIPYVTRNQGQEGTGFNDLVKVMDKKGEAKFYQNFINFNIENFHVEELNTLEDMMKGRQLKPKKSEGEEETKLL